MNKMKKMLLLIAVVIITFTWTGCTKTGSDTKTDANEQKEAAATKTTYPLTIEDDLGNKVTFDKEPQKIVSVAPSNTEILFALGLGDKVIGRTEYCNYPAQASDVEVVGGFSGPNTEKIIDLAPDVVFAYSSVSKDVKQLLEASNIKVVIYYPSSIDGILTNIKQVGQIANVQSNANELVKNMSIKRKEITAKVKDVKQKKVFVDIGNYYSVGPNSFIGSMLKEINVKNIATDANTDYPALTLEKIIEANPDVYISTITPAADIKKVVGIDSTQAYKDNMIIEFPFGTVEHDMIQQPGPRVVDGLEIYAKSIYPELFK